MIIVFVGPGKLSTVRNNSLDDDDDDIPVRSMPKHEKKASIVVIVLETIQSHPIQIMERHFKTEFHYMLLLEISQILKGSLSLMNHCLAFR